MTVPPKTIDLFTSHTDHRRTDKVRLDKSMACQVCKARKVKCDGRVDGGCLNCERLGLGCSIGRNGLGNSLPVSNGTERGSLHSPTSYTPSPSRARRTYRSCSACRSSKTKCNGEQPSCLRCRIRNIDCVYTNKSGPKWTALLQETSNSHEQSQLSPSAVSSNTAQAPDQVQARAAEMPRPASSYLIPQGNSLSRCPPAPPHRDSCSPRRQSIDLASSFHDDSVMEDATSNYETGSVLQSSGEVRAHCQHSSVVADSNAEIPHTLQYLYSRVLPEDTDKLRRLVDHYFKNVHPLRCFGFIHKPSYVRRLDDAAVSSSTGLQMGAEAFAPGDSDEMALLQVICAHGAKFCALAYSENIRQQPAKLVQAAGHEWAKSAEQTLMTNYGRITVTGLMTSVLLYDYRYRLGDFAHALIMSGVTTRMAHALQLNMEHIPRTADSPGTSGSLSTVERESRRRLMWACYIIDTWTGSGMDQLTLLREQDLHIQLPCNERDFLFQREIVTRKLYDSTPVRGSDGNIGLMSSYIRIVSIWKRVARYVKHLDTAALPWLPSSEFTVLDNDLRSWRENLAPYLDFSPDSIYTRLESSQLGALALLHCTYYNAMLDLYRIAMPELFSLRHAFNFPPEQVSFLHTLQARSFRLACGMATVLDKTAAQGARHLADSMTPMFAYNSSRVMLYYLVRIHDPRRPETNSIVQDTIRHVQSNNRVLHMASSTMPLSELLLKTARGWLDKLQSGLKKQEAATAAGVTVIARVAGVIPSGPSDIATLADPTSGPPNDDNQSCDNHSSDPANTIEASDEGADSTTDTPDNVLHPLSLFRLARKTLNDQSYTDTSPKSPNISGGLPPLRDATSGNQGHGLDHGRQTVVRQPVIVTPARGHLVPDHATPDALVGSTRDSGLAAAQPLVATYNGNSHAHVPSATLGHVNWESSFDDLAMGLHVLKDYPHWDLNGFDHIGSNLFENNGMSQLQ